MGVPAIKSCRVVVEFTAESGYQSAQEFAGDEKAMLDAYQDLGRILCVAGKDADVLAIAAEVKAAADRDRASND